MGAVAVQYGTADGTAVAGLDYTATTGSVLLAAGETSKQFTIPITDDNVYEQLSESFSVELTRACDGAVLGAVSSTEVIITGPNDFERGTLQLQSATASVSESDGTVTFEVTRTAGSNGLITVEYAAASGTAVEGVDFVASTGVLEFGTGVLTKSFTVPLIDDASCDLNSNAFAVMLYDVTGGGSIGAISATTVTIAGPSDDSGVYVGGTWALAMTKPTGQPWSVFGLSLAAAAADFSTASVLRVTVKSSVPVELRVELQSNVGGATLQTTELGQSYTVGAGMQSLDFEFSSVLGQFDPASTSSLIMYVNGGESMAWSGTLTFASLKQVSTGLELLSSDTVGWWDDGVSSGSASFVAAVGTNPRGAWRRQR